jgi:hypothetical protein
VENNHDGTDKLLLATRPGRAAVTPPAAASLPLASQHSSTRTSAPSSASSPSSSQTSNLTPLARVSAVFDNDGTGKRGNLAAVVKAILMDAEARGIPTDANYGHLKEPVLIALNLLRAFDARSIDGLTGSDGYINPQTRGMEQDVWRPPTVFSYFPFDFEVPGMPGVAGPEFGILSASTSLRRANFTNLLVFTGIVRTTGNNTNAPTAPR